MQYASIVFHETDWRSGDTYRRQSMLRQVFFFEKMCIILNDMVSKSMPCGLQEVDLIRYRKGLDGFLCPPTRGQR